MDTSRIETPRLVLRKARMGDLEHIWQNVWQDDSLAESMLWTPTHTREEAKSRMERTLRYQAEFAAYFVCLKDTDEPIGFAGVRETEPGVYEETGICVAAKCQGMGYGKEVVAALKKLVFEGLGGKRFIYACFSSNERSKGLCLSQGFRYLSSDEIVRERDGRKFQVDHYFIDREDA